MKEQDIPDDSPQRSREGRRASWFFGLVLVIVLVARLFLPMEHLAPVQERIMAFFTALVAGLFGYFFTGEILVRTRNVQAVGGAACFIAVLLWWLSPLGTPALEDQVRVRVQAVDSLGRLVEGAQLTSSLGGEVAETANGWEVTISRQRVRTDPVLVLTVTHQERRLVGSRTVRITDRPGTVRVRLDREPGAAISGIVIDQEGKPIQGALVTVEGEGSTTSNEYGGFRLLTHTPAGENVRLRTVKAGYRSFAFFHPTESVPATIELVPLEEEQ